MPSSRSLAVGLGQSLVLSSTTALFSPPRGGMEKCMCVRITCRDGLKVWGTNVNVEERHGNMCASCRRAGARFRK